MGLFFIGITLTFAVWSFVLPQDFFQVQNSKIDQIQGSIVEGDYIRGDFGSFSLIVQNNLQVMLFAFIFSLIFGAGAIFIITWNASILGIAITRGSTYLHEIPIVGLGYLPHGIPEILAYLCAGLAGGIISAAVIRKHDNRVLKAIMLDSAKILLLAIVLILIAGGIEVYL
jgi:stage II sporulation protein M